MAAAEIEQRAIKLAENAKDLVVKGEGEQATRALREALSLAPENVQIKNIALEIQSDEESQPLLKLCRKFAVEKDTPSGKDAVWLLAGSGAASVPSQAAESAVHLILEAQDAETVVRDDILAGLVQRCPGARRYIAKHLEESTSVTFGTLFTIGDGAANSITVVSLDSTAWIDETVRRRCEVDVFMLFLAKLLESGHDHDGRALKGISRHLAVDAEGLHSHVDEQSFGAILACLDYRLSEEVRGQATLATAKYLEAAKSDGEKYLTKFITTRTAKHSSEDLVLAFSAAAAVFPIATQLVSTLFLVEGFLPSLVPLLDKKSRPIKVEKAALDMLSAACIDAGCREAISKYCWEWMHHVMDDEEDERHGQAALILAKVQSQPAQPVEPSPETAGHMRRPSKEIADVVPKLIEMFVEGSEIDQRTGIEGLAYASVQPFVKEELVNDANLLSRLFKLPKKDNVSSTTAFGYLTLIDNLTRYLPVLSEEQKKLSELKAYANASKPQSKPHPLDESDNVTERCKKCLDARLVPFLVTLKSASVASPLSPTCLGLIAKIFLSLSKTPAHRGFLAQQGAIPLLLQIYGGLESGTPIKAGTAHGLARILISIDPALIPGYTTACVRPLLSLIDKPSSFTDGDQPRDLLPTFEALLALTNLVSASSLQTGPSVVKSAYSTIEDLLLHSNTLVQRAATELICNLALFPEGLEKLADGSAGAAKRLHVLLALADAEDVATRQAASGALAAATEFPDAIGAVLKREGGVKRLVDLCNDEDEGCVHRGVVCVSNLCLCSEPVGHEARRALKSQGAVERLGDVLKKWQNPAILQVVLEALKPLASA